ncbi:MAG: aminomethyl-transferring glycine dehydrogenase subunit GcvPB [Alphaproteobacteria bacterium]|nr:aminomethyl-transferring glycine dehydrogenase subunit GcvPB [Alphaproteobacteria bacterium]
MSGQDADLPGHRGLQFEEPLIFAQDSPGSSGVDFPAELADEERLDAARVSLGGLLRRAPIGLPGFSEPEAVRHYTRLSQKNYSIDTGLYPLGSCTMKHNPRLNEKLARLAGIGDLHPLQPQVTVQGMLELYDRLAGWLIELTGMPAVAMSPAAGAHGELCGMMCIRAAIDGQEGETSKRRRVLVPESAHGTNPATANLSGFTIDTIPADKTGRVDLAAFTEKLGSGEDVAGLMLTNPNTCGLFETDIIEIAAALHEKGAYLYCDGANLNAIVGRVRPGDLGIDCMHINLHKTFSTPHGGGGPGAGPVTLSAALAPYAPVPWVVRGPQGAYELVEDEAAAQDRGMKPFGRLKGFHGQTGMFVRALAYMMSHGRDGLRQVSGDAVLSANYVLARLKDVMSPAYPGLCKHEVLFDDRFLIGTGVTTMDFAKAMIDAGFHPMTVYFPLVVHGAMLVEPTETESKHSLDAFIAVMRDLASRAKAGETELFHHAPTTSPRRRIDETGAARHPTLRWKPDRTTGAAAD